MKSILLIIAVTICGSVLFAQKKDSDDKQDKPTKAERISERIQLTLEERAKFIPVFEEYDNAVKAVKKHYKEEWIKVKDHIDKISDKEAGKLADDYIIMKQQIFDLKKRYHSVFKDLLPPKKLLDLYKGKAKKDKDSNK